jgi:hypothetical protein
MFMIGLEVVLTKKSGMDSLAGVPPEKNARSYQKCTSLANANGDGDRR